MNGLERAAQGIYISADTWEDELFIFQKRYPAIVFDGETALYLHGLTEREYSEVHVGVPKGFNPYRLKEKGIIVHIYSDEVYPLGIAEMQTDFHNKVRVYDKERCICNIIATYAHSDIAMSFATWISAIWQLSRCRQWSHCRKVV